MKASEVEKVFQKYCGAKSKETSSLAENIKDVTLNKAVPVLLAAAATVPIFGSFASVASQLYSQVLKVLANCDEFKKFKLKVDRLVNIIINRVDVIKTLIEKDENIGDLSFESLLKEVIFALDQATEVIKSYATDQASRIDKLTGALKQIVLPDNFKDKMAKSTFCIIEAMSFLTFYAVMSPTSNNSLSNDDKAVLRDILQKPLTTFNETQDHTRRMSKPSRLWLVEDMFNWLNDPISSKVYFLQGGAGNNIYIIQECSNFYYCTLTYGYYYLCYYYEL